MTSPRHLADALDGVANACREADPSDWSPDDYDAVLRGLNTVSYEVVGLAARIREAMVNNTPVPHPVKPYTPPPPPPDPKPEPPPPPPPPTDRGAA